MKNFKTIIFVITLLYQNIVFAKFNKELWNNYKVEKILDNETLLISDGRVIKIWGIKSPSPFLKGGKNACFARPSFRMLKEKLENNPIKIWEKKRQSLSSVQPKHIKFEKAQYLTEFMLENGLGTFQNPEIEEKFVSKYQKAEIKAQKNKKGLWGCFSNQKFKNKIPFYFRKKYNQFLSNISVGRVKKVISGTTFMLENGIKVKMIGILSPDSNDYRKGFSCFGKASKESLESLILNKKIHLIRDKVQFSDGYLLRYVFLVPQKNKAQIFINKKMIEDGFAKSYWEDKNDFYKTDFESIQKEVYKNPCGAWVQCIQEILKNSQKKDEKILDFDKNCRIKGNISGSKKNPVKKYHTPTSRWYKNLKYEACFETEEEAEFDGFLKVK